MKDLNLIELSKEEGRRLRGGHDPLPPTIGCLCFCPIESPNNENLSNHYWTRFQEEGG